MTDFVSGDTTDGYQPSDPMKREFRSSSGPKASCPLPEILLVSVEINMPACFDQLKSGTHLKVKFSRQRQKLKCKRLQYNNCNLCNCNTTIQKIANTTKPSNSLGTGANKHISCVLFSQDWIFWCPPNSKHSIKIFPVSESSNATFLCGLLMCNKHRLTGTSCSLLYLAA